MFRRLASDSLLYGAAMLLVRGLQIFLLPVYTSVLGAGHYGVVEVATIAGALVNLTVALEVSQGMARYVADSPLLQDRRRYATTAVLFASAAYTAFFLFVAMASESLSRWLFDGQAGASDIVLIAAALALNGVFVLLQDLLRWLLRPGAYLLASLAYAAGTVSVGATLVAHAGWGVSGVFWGQLAGAALGLAVAAWSARSLLGFRADSKAFRTMLRFSLPLVVSGVAVFFSTFVDRIVVRNVLGLEALGVYGVAARFASVTGILTVGLQAALSPLVYRAWREQGMGEQLAQAFRFYCFGMLPVLGALSLFAGEILLAATGPEFHDARHVLPILAAASILAALYVFAPGLFLGERTGRVALLNLAGAAFNLALCLTLVPLLGPIGAALAAIIAAASVFAGFVGGGNVHFRVPFDASSGAAALALVVALVTAGLAWNYAAPRWDLSQLLGKSALLVLATLIAFVVVLRPGDRLRLRAAVKRLTSNSLEKKTPNGY